MADGLKAHQYIAQGNALFFVLYGRRAESPTVHSPGQRTVFRVRMADGLKAHQYIAQGNALGFVFVWQTG